MEEKTSGRTIEETFQELDRIMEKLDAPETSLEESFGFYETGMKLVRECGEKIDRVEKQIMILQEGTEEDGCA
ncbi:MAG: exodeoxyribonuclease VII small subunit [Lachnospiraceae bacterium]|nr:exodeoxyribonuclease VII small subunit [Lachnospiraceae bacterium]